jgi:NCAIR mutase (PurE)-related protein
VNIDNGFGAGYMAARINRVGEDDISREVNS